MKNTFYVLLIAFFIFNCNTSKKLASKKEERLERLKQNESITNKV